MSIDKPKSGDEVVTSTERQSQDLNTLLKTTREISDKLTASSTPYGLDPQVVKYAQDAARRTTDELKAKGWYKEDTWQELYQRELDLRDEQNRRLTEEFPRIDIKSILEK